MLPDLKGMEKEVACRPQDLSLRCQENKQKKNPCDLLTTLIGCLHSSNMHNLPGCSNHYVHCGKCCSRFSLLQATSALLRRSQKDFHAAVCDRERYKQVVVQLLAGSGRMLEEFDLDRGAETLQEERRTQLSSLTQDRDFYHDECKRMQAKERKVPPLNIS